MSRPSVANVAPAAGASSAPALPAGFPPASSPVPKGFAQRFAEDLASKVNAELTKVEQAFAFHDGTISTADGKGADAQSRVAVLEGQNLDARITTIEGDYVVSADIADFITSADTYDDTALAGRVSVLEGQNLDARIASIEAVNVFTQEDQDAFVAPSGAFGLLQTAVNDNHDAIATKADASTVSAIDGRVATLESADVASGADLTALEGRVDDLVSNTDPSALDSLSEIVTAFQNADSDLSAAINSALGTHTSELNAYTSATDPRLAALEQAVADLHAQMNQGGSDH